MQGDISRWLRERENLTLLLESSPYNLYTYLQRATVHELLGYPDLAASDAYKALLLTDEVLDEYGEFHNQASSAIKTTLHKSEGSENGDLLELGSGVRAAAFPPVADYSDGDQLTNKLARKYALQCYHRLACALAECGDLKSAFDFVQRGLIAFPQDDQLQLLQQRGLKEHRRGTQQQDSRLDDSDFNPREDLTNYGSVRREIYPWNTYEPDRFLEEHVSYINRELRRVALKCEVRATELPLLHMNPSCTNSRSTIKQLGIFATSDVAPGEELLEEPSVLTSSTTSLDSICDACSAPLPAWSSENPLPACPLCEDTVFCSNACVNRAQILYHPAICGASDFDVVAKDPSPFAATSALYTLLLARTIAMAETMSMHPLDLPQIKYLWGDYSCCRSVSCTLPFTFESNIAQPIHLLARLDKDPFATSARYDTWIINTLLAKFRGTANAKMNERTGIPEVAGVHWLWSLANHSCAPNVRWEWKRGIMGFVARRSDEVIEWGENIGHDDENGRCKGGIRKGEEILNHYCDVDLPVTARREVRFIVTCWPLIELLVGLRGTLLILLLVSGLLVLWEVSVAVRDVYGRRRGDETTSKTLMPLIQKLM